MTGAELHVIDGAAEPRIRWLSPEELRASTPAEVPWRLHGYLAAGNVTVLAGKPKAGKSTLGFAIADAIAARASSFLGRSIDGGPVVYASEEGAATLIHKLPAGDLRIATRETAWPRPTWRELVDAAGAEAGRVKATVVVIDTFAFWAGLPAESEKDAGAVQAAMEPLVALAAAGFAPLLVVHARKGGGEDGEAVRGSTALAGAADIVLELERVGSGSPRQRKLLALSRYPQTPGVLVIDHDPATGSWCVIGEGTDRGDARDIANRGALLDALSYDTDLARGDLENATGKPAREWHATLDQLIADGHAKRSGAGKKGDPYRYRKLRAEDAAQNAQNCAETSAAAAGFSGAHHVVVHQKQHDAAPTPDAAQRAESSNSQRCQGRQDPKGPHDPWPSDDHPGRCGDCYLPLRETLT